MPKGPNITLTTLAPHHYIDLPKHQRGSSILRQFCTTWFLVNVNSKLATNQRGVHQLCCVPGVLVLRKAKRVLPHCPPDQTSPLQHAVSHDTAHGEQGQAGRIRARSWRDRLESGLPHQTRRQIQVLAKEVLYLATRSASDSLRIFQAASNRITGYAKLSLPSVWCTVCLTLLLYFCCMLTSVRYLWTEG
jgi:hypothetical protein